MAHNPRCRDWCFTAFQVDPPTYDVSCHVYLVFQREVCPETGRQHWQGFVVYKDGKTRSASQAAIGCPNSHHEKRRGTRQQAAEYCKKEESRVPGTNFREFGELPEERGQGHRSDLQGVADSIEAGASRSEIAGSNPSAFIKYHRGIDAFIAATRTEPRDGSSAPEVRIYIGPPGCGKTRSVYAEFKSVYVKDPETVWWDGYEQEQCILLDDFTGGMSYKSILALTDRYSLQVQNKGGHTKISRRSTHIVFTSNLEPSVWWGPMHDNSAFNRRVTKIKRWRPVVAAPVIVIDPPEEVVDYVDAVSQEPNAAEPGAGDGFEWGPEGLGLFE